MVRYLVLNREDPHPVSKRNELDSAGSRDEDKKSIETEDPVWLKRFQIEIRSETEKTALSYQKQKNKPGFRSIGKFKCRPQSWIQKQSEQEGENGSEFWEEELIVF
jgi:hypothetical protein